MPIRVCRLLLVLAALPIGCARVSTGVQPAGGADTYVLTERDSPVNGGARRAERVAMAEAESRCQALGRRLFPVSAQVLGRSWQRGLVGDTGVRLTFRCQNTDVVPEAAVPAGAASVAPDPTPDAALDATREAAPITTSGARLGAGSASEQQQHAVVTRDTAIASREVAAADASATVPRPAPSAPEAPVPPTFAPTASASPVPAKSALDFDPAAPDFAAAQAFALGRETPEGEAAAAKLAAAVPALKDLANRPDAPDMSR